MAGFILGVIVLLWLRTLRLRLAVHAGAEASGPRVFAFFHGQQMALLSAPRHRRTCVLVSFSRDGILQAGVLRTLGFAVERGSSSRGAAAGLRAMARLVGLGHDAAFAVDGPRGPRERAKPGAAKAALLAGALLVPIASASRRAFVLRRAWDRFEVPWPFSRVAVVVGPPLPPDVACRRPELLEGAIEAARNEALCLLETSGASWQSVRVTK